MPKLKEMVHSSMEAAILAVEIYNKPRVPFRVQSYVSLMIIAWTRLFHTYFKKNIGEKYYYKYGNKYITVDGDRKTWELKTCMEKYGKLSEPARLNLEFFIKLRNKIEHRHVDNKELEVNIYGECQSLLYNFETLLVLLFGESCTLNASLAFSLQFSMFKNKEKDLAIRNAITGEMKDIIRFVDTYRSGIRDQEFHSQEFSIKLLQIPKVANCSRSSLAVEFVKWDDLSETQKSEISKITAIIKEKEIIKEVIVEKEVIVDREKIITKYVARKDCHKPGQITEIINKQLPDEQKINITDLRNLAKIFRIRPFWNIEPGETITTNEKYCIYDKAHKDFLYSTEFGILIIDYITKTHWTRSTWKRMIRLAQYKQPP